MLLALLVVAGCGDAPQEPDDDPKQPRLIQLDPFRTNAGDGDLTLALNGEDFTSDMTVLWNGTVQSTSLESASQLTATIPEADLAAPGIVEVAVSNPTTGETTSPLPFFIQEPEAVPRFVYVVNDLSDNISAYQVDAMTGDLEPVPGSPFASLARPHRLAVNPSGEYLYVLHMGLISWLRIDRTTGALTSLTTSPVPGQDAMDMDPAGAYLFTLIGGAPQSDIVAYAIDAATGTLSDSPVARVSTQGGSGLTMEATGRFIYTANSSRFVEGGVHGFRFDRGTLELEHNGAHPPAGHRGSARDPTGGRIVIARQASLDIGFLTAPIVEPLTGALQTSVGSMELWQPTGEVAVDHVGRHAYTTTTGGIAAAVIDTVNGTLTSIDFYGYPDFPELEGAVGMTVSPTGRHLYVTTWHNTVLAIPIDDQTGALDVGAAKPFAAGRSPVGIVVVM